MPLAVQKVFIKLLLFIISDEIRILLNPRCSVFKLSDFFRKHGFELLEEVDSPSREANHFIASGVLFQGVQVDETVDVVLLNRLVHLAQKIFFYTNQI
jgi:hypothetical protein